MADVAAELLRALSGFAARQLQQAAQSVYQDASTLLGELDDDVPASARAAFDELRDAVAAGDASVQTVVAAIEKAAAVVGRMAARAVADAQAAGFTVAAATGVAESVATALLAVDEAVRVVAREVSKAGGPTVDEAVVADLMAAWSPWTKPFQQLGDGVGGVVTSLAQQLMGVDGGAAALADVLAFDPATLRLSATLTASGPTEVPPGVSVLTLRDASLEVALSFVRTPVAGPSAAEQADLVEVAGSFFRGGQAVFGVRFSSVVEPALADNPLLSAFLGGASDGTTTSPTAIGLDSAQGLVLGTGSGQEKVVLPFAFSFPGVQVREVALGLARGAGGEVVGLELTTMVAADLGDAVALQVGGAGAVISLQGGAGEFPLTVEPRWPDRIGLRVKAGPISGGGYLERVTRVYDGVPVTEFGGVIQLEILGAGVYAIGILTPDPFSMVLVMGVRFPVPIDLSFGFTFNGVGGILAIDRTVDSDELVKGMQSHFIDEVLFPDDPVAQAPTILDKVARVFPPAEGGFVVGPILELGWGSQARIVEAKVGVVLSLPDPKLIVLGSIRVRAPAKDAPITDLRCEIFGEVTADHLLVRASLRDSTIATFSIDGDLGLLIQWGGGGAFALSVGGFNPRYKDVPPELAGMSRIVVDLSPPVIVTIVIKAYFAVTAGAVMLGVRGDLEADVGVASAHAWVEIDMIFFWVPRFGFAIDVKVGIDIEVFGASFASVRFTGLLEGTAPWRVQGTATIDVWWLPTFDFELGPITWGEDPKPLPPTADPLDVVAQALAEPTAWKAVLPQDLDQLALLAAAPEGEGLVAHPLAALEVSQSKVPLETHVERIGSAGVVAHRVHLGLPTTSVGEVGAVSTVSAPFAPGQFLDLRDEKLLARSGFEDLPSGCRMSAATTPVHGASQGAQVVWQTYIREDDEPVLQVLRPGMYAQLLVDHSLASRTREQRRNPYLPPRPGAAQAQGAGGAVGSVRALAAGSARVHLADDGGQVLADLGVMGASQAAWVADQVNASGAAHVAAVTLGAL